MYRYKYFHNVLEITILLVLCLRIAFLAKFLFYNVPL